MSAEEIVKIYQEIIANPDKLKQGKEILENLISTVPQFATLTCKIITSQEIPAQFRKHVCYIIKNVLKDVWMVSPALNNERTEIKEILLTGMVTNMKDFKIIEALSLITAEVIKQEGVAGWQPYLNELIKWINTNEIPRITAGVECLCLIFKQTDDTMSLIVPELMPVLYQIFNLPELPERGREKILMLLYLCIKTFEWAEGANDELISQCFDSTFEQWLTIFVKVLETPAKDHISMKKYIFKILTKIFSELKKYSAKAIVHIIQPVWKFMNASLPLFTWSVVYGVPIEDVQEGMKTMPQSTQTKKETQKDYANEGFELDDDPDLFNEAEAMAVQLIQLMQTLLTKKKIKGLVQAGLFPLINCLCHYMMFSKYQEKTWFEDPNEFQAEEEDTVNMVSLRRDIIQVLETLIDRFADAATQTIMVIAEKFLSNMKEEDSYGYLKEVFDKLENKQVDLDTLTAMVKTSHFEGEHPDHVWKKRELGLLLMGTFAYSIVEHLSSTGSDTNVLTLIEKLVGDFGNDNNAILKGRSLWCITQFSELVGGQGLKPLLTLFKLSANCLGDTHLPVRLTAAKAIRIFAYKIEQDFIGELNEQIKAEYHLSDVQIVNQLLELLDKCSEDTLHIILEGLVVFSRLNPQHIPRISEVLCTKVTELFQLVHNDMLNGPVLKDLIRHCTQVEQGVPHFVNVFLPYISEIFQFKLNNGGSIASHITLGSSTEENFFASLFDILRLLVESNVNKQREPIMELLPFLLKFMNECTDYDMLSHASICLKAYVSNYSQVILEKNYQQDVIAIIYKLLRSDTTEELSCTYIGNLILITFANLLNNSLDTEMLKEVIHKIAKAEITSTIQSLVIVYARLINISEKEVLDFLCSFRVGDTLALKVLLDKWLFHQPLFQGKNAKTLTLLGLTRLFMAKDSRVENLKVVGYDKNSTEETYAPFRIMSVLIKGLDNEIQSQSTAKNTGNLNKISQLMKDYAAAGDDEDDDEGFEDVDEDGNFYGDEGEGKDPEAEEAVKITEEDLISLKDVSATLDTLEMLKEFFLAVAKKDHEYFTFCVKNMPNDFAEIVQRYMQF